VVLESCCQDVSRLSFQSLGLGLEALGLGLNLGLETLSLGLGFDLGHQSQTATSINFIHFTV